MLRRLAGLKGAWSYVVTAHSVLAWSGFFEVVEAVVAHVVSPELGAAYNGIQGDIWDAQKDMILALAGAVICMTVTALLRFKTGDSADLTTARIGKAAVVKPLEVAHEKRPAD
jgi:putative membrane protein